MKKLIFKTMTLVTVLTIAFIAVVCVKNEPVTVNADSIETLETSENNIPDDSEVVVSYLDVFRQYYDQMERRMSEGNIENPYSFEEFCDGYYQFDLELQEYTDLLVDEAYGIICMADYEVSLQSSEDAKYILKSISKPNEPSTFNPDVTPASAFRRNLKYGNYVDDENDPQTVFDYSTIKDGDILLETNTILSDIGHTAFVYDVNKRTTASTGNRTTYIQTVEAVGDGVQFGFLDDQRMVEFGVVVLRATSFANIVNVAKQFIIQQVGKPYSFPSDPGRINTDTDSTEWYCSELINAAYKYAGCNLGAETSDGYVWPQAIMLCGGTNFVCFSNCLDAFLRGKSNGKWQIRIFNRNSNSVTMEYNKKLANFDDAKNWTKSLKNTATVTISAYGYVDVEISTNLFATTAVFSLVQNGYRCVTYCKNLNSNTCRMSVFRNRFLVT